MFLHRHTAPHPSARAAHLAHLAMHGQFTWYELTTPDVEAAKRFYPRFTGWGTQRFDNDYTMWTTGGAPVAGLFRLSDDMRQQGVPPNWMAYVEADDVDATAANAVSLGGRVLHGPADIPGTGRFAVLQDPQGAAFGIYRSSGPSGAWDGTPVAGRFSWHELMTTDYTRAFEFYRALFGWEQMGEMDMGGGQMYALFGKYGAMYGGMFNRHGDMQAMPPFWLLYINVDDVATALAAATKAGGTVHRPQMDIPGGSIAILGDPQGAGFALHHVSAPAAAPKPAKEKSAPAGRRSTRAAVKKAGVKKAAAKKTAAKRTAAKKIATPKKAAVKKAMGRKKAAVKKKAARTPARPAARRPKAVSRAAAGARRKSAKPTRTSRRPRPKARKR